MNMRDYKKVLIISNNIECERHVQYFSKIEKYFTANGWDIINDLEGFEKADKVVICACGYHKMMYDRVISFLKILREKGYTDDMVILTGCLPKTFEEQLKEVYAGHLVEFKSPEKFDAIIDSKINFSSIESSNIFKVWGNEHANKNKMFYIKISDGCVGHCTYCVIKRSKGHLQSMPKEEILKQYLKALQAGHRKIFLMGDDTFAYGVDIGANIIELVNYLLSYNDGVELYFGSLDVKWLKIYYKDILELCRSQKIKKLDFGMQHIKDNVLKLMSRERNFEEGYELIQNLKRECPDLYLSGDIMVGFPGEAYEDFDALLKFFQNDSCFNSIKHYGFSEIEGTPASKLPDSIKVPSLQIAHRWQLLKNMLAERSMYNLVNDPDSQGEAFQKTFEEDIFVCNDSYIDLD